MSKLTDLLAAEGLVRTSGKGDRRKRKHKKRRPFKSVPMKFSPSLRGDEEEEELNRLLDNLDVYSEFGPAHDYSLYLIGDGPAVARAIGWLKRQAGPDVEIDAQSALDEARSGRPGELDVEVYVSTLNGPDDALLRSLVGRIKGIRGITDAFHYGEQGYAKMEKEVAEMQKRVNEILKKQGRPPMRFAGANRGDTMPKLTDILADEGLTKSAALDERRVNLAVDMITDATNRNDHTYALKLLADLLAPGGRHLGIIIHLEGLADIFGHMPDELISLRRDYVYKPLLALAKRKLDREQYEAVYGAL